ncbi:hypothetical protein SPMU_14740 [Sphingomonas mucosissima]|uniref:Uncharacterized protein n=1 Tax=Sphingomonas mucosissima TaxID=370959 RepID=A0A245ZTQ3_9SPHN|nr:hypothetical protein SPMU_14740 [Sphingomonas mucosissima]
MSGFGAGMSGRLIGVFGRCTATSSIVAGGRLVSEPPCCPGNVIPPAACACAASWGESKVSGAAGVPCGGGGAWTFSAASTLIENPESTFGIASSGAGTGMPAAGGEKNVAAIVIQGLTLPPEGANGSL